jgi:hypothetical protein
VRRAHLQIALALVAMAGCRSKRTHDDPMPEPPVIADVPAPDAAKPWPELEGYTRVAAERVIPLPARADIPRFDVSGPVIAGDLAIVASSQFGFVAADYRRGTIAWSKPAGTHVAPPLVIDTGIVLIGDCVNPPAVGDREQLIGCMRIVQPTGTDQAYFAIRGKPKAVEAFVAERGAQRLTRDGADAVRWIRGDAALTIDLVTGAAKPADAQPPPIAIEYKTKKWDVAHVDGRVVGYLGGTKKVAWTTQYQYTALLGAVWLPEMGPMVRVANAGAFRESPEIHLIDIDATGSLRAQVAKPAPGVGVLGHATSNVGDAALAVRLDNTLRRDLVVGYSANALLLWVYPLPEMQRVDPVGIAISNDADAVVVFHDGDTITVLPELSAPPTTPGAANAASKKPTP